MDLFETILSVYPELTAEDFHPKTGSILLCDDGDGVQYIAKWDYLKPATAELKSYLR